MGLHFPPSLANRCGYITNSLAKDTYMQMLPGSSGKDPLGKPTSGTPLACLPFLLPIAWCRWTSRIFTSLLGQWWEPHAGWRRRKTEGILVLKAMDLGYPGLLLSGFLWCVRETSFCFLHATVVLCVIYMQLALTLTDPYGSWLCVRIWPQLSSSALSLDAPVPLGGCPVCCQCADLIPASGLLSTCCSLPGTLFYPFAWLAPVIFQVRVSVAFTWRKLLWFSNVNCFPCLLTLGFPST